METAGIPVRRYPHQFVSNDSRVITRLLEFPRSRVASILSRVVTLNAEQTATALAEARERFGARHRDVEQVFRDHYRMVRRHKPPDVRLTHEQKQLIGAYFTLEYSIESAALFNPSIVPHPDQSGLLPDAVRFLMSFRATGEGHLSSIVFRRGVMYGNGGMAFEPPPRFAHTTRPETDKDFDRAVFRRQLVEMGVDEPLVSEVLSGLPTPFRQAQLNRAIRQARHVYHDSASFASQAADIRWLARANYELHFPNDLRPAEIVIFPATENEQRGMEDLRLVHFTDDDGSDRYFGTYTAFDGRRILPMLLETSDFHSFHVRTLVGRNARNKGMALFPRRIDGAYVMVSRHDGENLFLMRSDTPYVWEGATLLQPPVEPWELVQIGNCGSPIETDRGWLLLTHGVGPMREYCIGATLLDLHDPSKIIGQTAEPLIAPAADERDGYVPNVVYTCGAMIHEGRLIIPYAMADSATGVATIEVDPLLEYLSA